MKTIKKEHIGLTIFCPIARKNILVDLIDPTLYDYYSSKGYDFLFEEIVEKPIVKKDFSLNGQEKISK